MRTHKPKHRHFVAVPVLLVALGCLYGIRGTFAADVVPSSSVNVQALERRIVEGVEDLKVQLDAGSEATFSLHDPSVLLSRGSALITTPTLASVRFGTGHSIAIAGGSVFLAVADDGSATIGPIDAAVVLSTLSNSFFVPAYHTLTLSSSGESRVTSSSSLWMREMQDQARVLLETQCAEQRCTMLHTEHCTFDDCPLRAILAGLRSGTPESIAASEKKLSSLESGASLQQALALHLLISTEHAVLHTEQVLSTVSHALRKERSRAILALSLVRNSPLSLDLVSVIANDVAALEIANPEEISSLRVLLRKASDVAGERGLILVERALEKLAEKGEGIAS